MVYSDLDAQDIPSQQPTNFQPQDFSMSDWIEAGTRAPAFTLTADDGAKVRLSALKGNPVVLYFYPTLKLSFFVLKLILLQSLSLSSPSEHCSEATIFKGTHLCGGASTTHKISVSSKA